MAKINHYMNNCIQIKISLALFAVFILNTDCLAQQSDDRLLWNGNYQLTVSDFGIKTNSLENSSSFAQFSLDYQLNGFDFMARNFNKKVRNYLIRSASWIDTSANIPQSLRYQQTLFNISEIYTRQFRKALRENRKKIIMGTQIAEELNQNIMAEFSKRRMDYIRETDYGKNEIKQKEWEALIQKEIAALNNFAFDR
ncbi:hypothetical protein [Pedobacter nanyangensis]|uniref:hypothetical protein n=1 Tax=Pedobacter nanyangensis TaxID=1562389 RepID=UPI001966AC7A|nr:hypothetical protein [Pedobacter nanyangensis]